MLQPRIPQGALRACWKCSLSPQSRSYAGFIKRTPPGTKPGTSSSAGPPSTRNTSLAIRTYKPRTPGTRHLRRPINDHLWKGRPHHSLTFPKKGHARGGRNNSGQVRVRHRGGGHKRRIRTVDFSRLAPGEHIVERIEHDPNRTAHIALVK